MSDEGTFFLSVIIICLRAPFHSNDCAITRTKTVFFSGAFLLEMWEIPNVLFFFGDSYRDLGNTASDASVLGLHGGIRSSYHLAAAACLRYQKLEDTTAYHRPFRSSLFVVYDVSTRLLGHNLG